MKQMEKPKVLIPEHIRYLDELRKSSTINMYQAGPYLQDDFDLNRHQAKEVLKYWMKGGRG